jgi:Lar family restriction alleviation protein
MGELKRCPFCGGEAEVIKATDELIEIECTYCGCSTGKYYAGYMKKTPGVKQAIDAWNNRADGWIKITDNPATLPKAFARVQIVRKNGRVGWGTYSYIEDWEKAAFKNEYGKVVEVTHWQPLPQLPKEGIL